MRPAIASPVALASLAVGLVVATGAGSPVHAAACPHADKPVTVAKTANNPGYTAIRGCIASFDGTPIVYNLFVPRGETTPSYTILVGHGWGGSGSTTPDANLINAHYAELTWDARGFGESGGVAEVDDPLAEGRDVSALIDDVLAPRHDIARDRNKHSATYGEPAVGMLGASYGGGIQLSTAAFDPRVKAIVPEWAWNDLRYSLFPGGTTKFGWGELLFGDGLAGIAQKHATASGTAGIETGGYDPNIYRAEAQGLADGFPDQQTLAWFGQRSMVSWGAAPGGHVPAVPTLLVQGSVDTLFNLSEAEANLEMIRAAHPAVPVKLIAFCGGHVSCPTGGGYSDTPKTGIAKGVADGAFIESAAINWFDVYLRHDRGARDRMPNVLAQDQTGTWHALHQFPTARFRGAATMVRHTVSGTVISTSAADAIDPSSGSYSPVVTDGPSPSGDPTAATIALLTAKHDELVVGEGHVSLDLTVDGPSSNVFFKLVDVQANKVLDLQTTAYRFDDLDLVDNAANPTMSKHISLDLVGVAWKLAKGHTLALQVATAALPFVPDRSAAIVQFSGSVSVPVIS